MPVSTLLSRRRLVVATTAMATALGAVTTLALPPSTAAAAGEPYRDASLPVATRVADLLGRMTLDEKVGQLNLISNDPGSSPDVGRTVRLRSGFKFNIAQDIAEAQASTP